MKIATNISALQARISITSASNASKSASGKLSSGLKINVAADDLTGMAISSRMKAQIRGSSRAGQNTMDGISLVQTADGALQEVHNMLQRIRELSVQAANSHYTRSDLENIQMEIDQMKEEIDAISQKTEFNKIKLFDGTAGLNTMGINADVLSVTATVKTGEYKISLIESGTKALYTTGSAINTQISFPSEQLKGTITINDISVEILGSDSLLTVQKKLMALADECDLVMTRSDDGASIESIEAKEAGSKHNISISSNNDLLLDVLGMNSNAVNVNGTDAKVELIRNSVNSSSVISDSATYTVDGNRITILDIDNQRIVADLNSDYNISSAGNHVNNLKDEIFKRLNIVDETYDKIAVMFSEVNSLSSLQDADDFADELLKLEKLALDTSEEAKGLMNEAIKLYPVLKELEAYKTEYPILEFHDDHYRDFFNTCSDHIQNAKDMIDNDDLDGAKIELGNAFSTGIGSKDGGGGVPGCSYEIVDAAYKIVQNMETQIKDIKECTINVSEGGLILQVGANEGMQLKMSISKVTAQTLSVDDLEINTIDKAQEAIKKCDFAIGVISDNRAMLGSYQNRLTHTELNLSSMGNNLSESLSVIQDADLAEEMAESTRNNVLEQAAMFILSQANQKPQELLQLLK